MIRIHYTLIITIYRCDDDVIERLRSTNFPPLIHRRNINVEHLSPYMKKRFEEENKKIDQECLVQTYRGEDLFVFSPLLQFYLKLGYTVLNIKLATQYLPERCFAPFIEKAVNMRIKATYENDETKANTAKTLVNASYGKVIITYKYVQGYNTYRIKLFLLLCINTYNYKSF